MTHPHAAPAAPHTVDLNERLHYAFGGACLHEDRESKFIPLGPGVRGVGVWARCRKCGAEGEGEKALSQIAPLDYTHHDGRGIVPLLDALRERDEYPTLTYKRGIQSDDDYDFSRVGWEVELRHSKVYGWADDLPTALARACLRAVEANQP